MTIPQLKKYSQRTDYEKRVQKAYVTLEEVIDNAVMEHGIIKHWAKKTSEDKLFSTYFIPYFSVLENKAKKALQQKTVSLTAWIPVRKSHPLQPISGLVLSRPISMV